MARRICCRESRGTARGVGVGVTLQWMCEVSRVDGEHRACDLEGEIVRFRAVERSIGSTQGRHDGIDDILWSANKGVALEEPLSMPCDGSICLILTVSTSADSEIVDEDKLERGNLTPSKKTSSTAISHTRG